MSHFPNIPDAEIPDGIVVPGAAEPLIPLEKQVNDLRKRVSELEKAVEELRTAVKGLEQRPVATPFDDGPLTNRLKFAEDHIAPLLGLLPPGSPHYPRLPVPAGVKDIWH